MDKIPFYDLQDKLPWWGDFFISYKNLEKKPFNINATHDFNEFNFWKFVINVFASQKNRLGFVFKELRARNKKAWLQITQDNGLALNFNFPLNTNFTSFGVVNKECLFLDNIKCFNLQTLPFNKTDLKLPEDVWFRPDIKFESLLKDLNNYLSEEDKKLVLEREAQIKEKEKQETLNMLEKILNEKTN